MLIDLSLCWNYPNQGTITKIFHIYRQNHARIQQGDQFETFSTSSQLSSNHWPIWRFPASPTPTAAARRLVPYLVALVFVGIPMLWLDYAVGHKFPWRSPPWALRKIYRRRRVHRLVPDLRVLRHHGLLRRGPRLGRAVHRSTP